MLKKLVDFFLILFVLYAATVASTHCTARADERRSTEAEQHQQMREWSAKRACPKGHDPEWIDSVTVQCLKVLP